MKLKITAIIALLAIPAASCLGKAVNLQQNTPVNFSQVKIDDSFWAPRIRKHAEVTVPFCLDQCMTKTHRVENFAIAAGRKDGRFEGIFFDDSDLYKVIEGVAYSLQNYPNPEIEHKTDSIINLIAAAQRPDGYINTYYTLTGLDKRWSDMNKHEMYCGGHMIEAAIAYSNATGKDALLDVAVKWADYLCATFGPGKRDWVPGHEEIELALVKLYRHTGKKDYLELAHFLLEERGHGLSNAGFPAEYDQDAVPVKDLRHICGHAVRAMYLFTGMADYAAAASDDTYLEALNTIWENLVRTQMYVTGGIGSSKHNEGFTSDYDLPNKDAYCETCASVGMVFWNQRMNMFSGDSKYIDVLERSLYNGAMAGMSVSCDRFFYVNPLESDGDHHRNPWYGCACCPSQISRFIASVGGYMYALSDKCFWVNLYAGSSTSVEIPGVKGEVNFSVGTAYPWDGAVKLTVNPVKNAKFTVKLRIPQWCRNWSAEINGERIVAQSLDKGYLAISRRWTPGDVVTLNLDMPVEVVQADPQVKENLGKRAIQRGPLVYCLEEVDNITIGTATVIPDDEYTIISNDAVLADSKAILARKAALKYIPYFLWDNRDPGRMKVWVDLQK